MYCLLQLYPPEAADDDERDCLDVIAVNRSHAALERFLETYEPRYKAACDAFQEWDNLDNEWTDAHEVKLEELRVRYDLRGTVIPDTEFSIVEAWK